MFMAGPVYPVSAMAASRARIARFSSTDYVAMLRESPETCLRMLGHLSQRLHVRIREIEHLTLESATHRLVRMIESRLPVETDGPAEIKLQESRQEIASRLSMKPETLSRILRTLSDSGTISVQGRVLRVPSRCKLLSILDTAA
jgi:CRP-like cAMP-binding protein